MLPNEFKPDPSQAQVWNYPMRRSLAATRESITHKFVVGNHEGYLTVGFHDDGSPGEIFLKMSKEGSTISGMCQAFCRAFSLSLQHGLPLHEACGRFKGMRFEPMGTTNNPAIPEASSIVDYIARFLEANFVDTTENSKSAKHQSSK